MTSQTKICTKCCQVLDVEAFPKRKDSKDGLHTWCRSCRADYNQAWKNANREHYLEYHAHWREDNREATRAYAREWGQNNPEKKREYERTFRRNHKEKYIEKGQRYQARKNGAYTESVDYADILNRDKGICQLCQSQVNLNPLRSRQSDSLAFDHIVPLSRGGSHTADNIQVAHFGCNSSKGDRILA